MRQAGILAAAGLYALEHHTSRLADDHEHAKALAEAVNSRFPGAAKQHTNMVFLDFEESELARLQRFLAAQQILIRGRRWVTHLDVSSEDTLKVCRAVLNY